MPIVNDITMFVNSRKTDLTSRTLVLWDKSTGVQVYATFSFPYDSAPSPDAVAQLFEASIGTLANSSLSNYTEETLPIIRYIGRGKVTIVVRSAEGSLTIDDGLGGKLDKHIGVGD